MTEGHPKCEATGKASYATASDAEQARTEHQANHVYLCRHGCGHWHLTTQPYLPINLDRRRRRAGRK